MGQHLKGKIKFWTGRRKAKQKERKRSSKFSSRILESWGTRVFLPLSRNWIRVRVQGRRTPGIPPPSTKHFPSLFLPRNFLGSGYLVRKGQWVILLAMYFWVELPQYLQCQSAWPSLGRNTWIYFLLIFLRKIRGVGVVGKKWKNGNL